MSSPRILRCGGYSCAGIGFSFQWLESGLLEQFDMKIVCKLLEQFNGAQWSSMKFNEALQFSGANEVLSLFTVSHSRECYSSLINESRWVSRLVVPANLAKVRNLRARCSCPKYSRCIVLMTMSFQWLCHTQRVKFNSWVPLRNLQEDVKIFKGIKKFELSQKLSVVIHHKTMQAVPCSSKIIQRV